MKIELPVPEGERVRKTPFVPRQAVGEALRQSDVFRPAVLIAWLVARNGALVVRIRQLEEEVERLSRLSPLSRCPARPSLLSRHTLGTNGTPPTPTAS